MVARKSVAALIVLLVIMTGTAFAAPLKPAEGFGDSRIYDQNYKSVKVPSELSEGYVIVTEEEILVLENSDTKVEIGPHSIAQIVSLNINPEFYILDGRAEISSKAGFTVRTTVTSYKAEALTTIFVITEDSEETAFVAFKSAVASNLITGNVTTIVAGKYIDNAKNGFAPAEKSLQEYWAKTIAQPEPEPEPEPEPMVYSKTISYNGFSARIEATVGEACITYPSFITYGEVADAFAAVATVYPEFSKDLTFSFGNPGTVYVHYPQSYGEAEFNLAVGILQKELPAYIDGLLAYYAAQEKAAQEQAAKEQAEVSMQPMVRDFTYRGFEATVSAYVGAGFITYPSYVTDDEMNSCASALVQLHPADFSEIRYTILRQGLAEVTYPETYGEAEFNRLTDIVEQELHAYIDYVWVTPEPTKAPEVVAEVQPEVQPEPEKTPIETSPRPEEPVAEPVEETQSDFKFGVSFGAIWGFGEGDESGDPDYFSAPQFLKHRIGVFKKNVMLIVNPFISYDNFQFGLHLKFRWKNGELVRPFSINTKNGITGYVNSVARYISVLSYSTKDGSFSFGATRNTELDFRSPIFEPFRLGYDKDDRLQLTVAVQAGGFAFKAFVEDLEFKNKINGRSDYSGLRASFSFKKFEIGISAVADIKNGIKNMTFYPGADIVIPLEFGRQTLEISTQVAAQISSGKINAVLAKAYVDTITFDWLKLGLGVAYNYKSHINEIMNNGPVDVIEQFSGNSLDLTFRAGIDAGPLSFIGKVTVPVALSGGSRLAYNTVRTRSGNKKSITADTMDIQFQLTFGKFKFNAGMIYNGFAGKAADLFKAIIKWSGKEAALKALLDPEYSTFYANAIFGTQVGDVVLSAFVRADLTRVNGLLVVPLSAGIGFTY